MTNSTISGPFCDLLLQFRDRHCHWQVADRTAIIADQVITMLTAAPESSDENGRNGRLLIITLDPAHDTATTLKVRGNPSWLEASLRPRHRRRGDHLHIRRAMWNRRARRRGALHDNLRTLVVDAQGRIARILKGNTWTAGELTGALAEPSRTR